MTKLEMVQSALTESGETTAEALAAFVDRKYGLKIDPKFIPIFKASIRDMERLEAARQAARAAAEQAQVEAAAG